MTAWDGTCRLREELSQASRAVDAARAAGLDDTAAIAEQTAAAERLAAHLRRLEESERGVGSFWRGGQY